MPEAHENDVRDGAACIASPTAGAVSDVVKIAEEISRSRAPFMVFLGPKRQLDVVNDGSRW